MSLERDAAIVGNSPFFFLSYARTPRQHPTDTYDPDKWVYKLYRDLCETILQLTNVECAGFMDREVHIGSKWPQKLAEALATCHVFVPLYSPRYFASDNCGKEWYAFIRRALNHRARKPHTVPAIVPALWVSVDQETLPDAARMIQFNHHDLGNRYGAEGFYGIMKVARYRNDYQLAVHRLARRIVDVARETRISAEPPVDYMSVESAFGFHGEHRASRHQMRFTVVAPDASNLPPGRGTDYYGTTPREWNPYHPEISQPIAEYAVELASCLGYHATVDTLGEHSGYENTQERSLAPGLFLVDPWAARSAKHREHLQRIDVLDQPWTSVLLPWNRNDGETAQAEPELRADLSLCLGHKLADIPHKYQTSAVNIPTLHEFGELLGPMAMNMFKRFVQHAPVYPPEGAPTARPRLLGPEGDTGNPGGTR